MSSAKNDVVILTDFHIIIYSKFLPKEQKVYVSKILLKWL